LCAGHTHVPLQHRVGRRFAVNLGSVSNPSPHSDGTASYVVIDATGPASAISHRAVAYDLQAVIDRLLLLRYPAVGFIGNNYFGRLLATTN
jgi:hypothetical protein